jgi:K+-transporting ATPase KdpF subunit
MHRIPDRLRKTPTMEDIIAGFVAGALILYLLWTLIRPERF